MSLEHVSGEDDLGLALSNDRVLFGLRRSGRVPDVLVATFFNDYMEIDTTSCVLLSTLTFAYDGTSPVLNEQIAYSFDEELGGWDAINGITPIFFIDINEERDTNWLLGDDIDYVGTEGSFAFTSVNAPGELCQPVLDCKDVFYHSLALEITFSRWVDGTRDESVQTELRGELTVFTEDPL